MSHEVLLVEDNPADAYLTCDVLGRNYQSCKVAVATDGAKAISMLRESSEKEILPDLIILDLNLPRKDGWAVLAELKTDRSLQKIPVIVFTTSQAQADIESSYDLGANCYMQKPGNLADFVSAVEAMSQFWLGAATLPSREGIWASTHFVPSRNAGLRAITTGAMSSVSANPQPGVTNVNTQSDFAKVTGLADEVIRRHLNTGSGHHRRSDD